MMPFGLNQERTLEIQIEKQRTEISHLRADVLRLQREKLEYFEHNIELRAALEYAVDVLQTIEMAYDDRKDEKLDFDDVKELAGYLLDSINIVLKSAPADETASATSPATAAKPESDK